MPINKPSNSGQLGKMSFFFNSCPDLKDCYDNFCLGAFQHENKKKKKADGSLQAWGERLKEFFNANNVDSNDQRKQAGKFLCGAWGVNLDSNQMFNLTNEIAWDKNNPELGIALERGLVWLLLNTKFTKPKSFFINWIKFLIFPQCKSMISWLYTGSGDENFNPYAIKTTDGNSDKGKYANKISDILIYGGAPDTKDIQRRLGNKELTISKNSKYWNLKNWNPHEESLEKFLRMAVGGSKMAKPPMNDAVYGLLMPVWEDGGRNILKKKVLCSSEACKYVPVNRKDISKKAIHLALSWNEQKSQGNPHNSGILEPRIFLEGDRVPANARGCDLCGGYVFFGTGGAEGPFHKFTCPGSERRIKDFENTENDKIRKMVEKLEKEDKKKADKVKDREKSKLQEKLKNLKEKLKKALKGKLLECCSGQNEACDDLKKEIKDANNLNDLEELRDKLFHKGMESAKEHIFAKSSGKGRPVLVFVHKKWFFDEFCLQVKTCNVWQELEKNMIESFGLEDKKALFEVFRSFELIRGAEKIHKFLMEMYNGATNQFGF